MYLIFTSVALTLAVWSKLPSLPAVLFPLSILLFEKRHKGAAIYVLAFSLSFVVFTAVVCFAYGLSDVLFYIIQFPSWSRWSYRNELFDGTNAILKTIHILKEYPCFGNSLLCMCITIGIS